MSDPLTTLSDLLSALEDPARGGEVHDMHDQDAMLPLGGGIVRRGDIDRAAYAAAFAADTALYERVRPGRPRGPAIADPALAGQDGDVAWFTAREARTGTPLRLALGLAPGGIDWLTIAPADAAWTRAQGRVQALADHAYGRGIYPRTWLDCAWQRLHGHARPPLNVLPEAAFACAGSSDCCRIDWAIEVDASFQAVIDAIDFGPERPELAGTRLIPTPDGKLALKRDAEPCRFLDPDGRCAVHRVVGRQIFPPCALFPFAFAQTPDGIDFSTSSLCAAARTGLGPPLSSRTEDLWDRLAIAANAPLRTPVYRLAAGREVDWPAFKAAEAALLAALAREELPLPERLRLGTAALGVELPAIAPLPAEQREIVQAFLWPWIAHLGLPKAPAPPPGALRPELELEEASVLARVLRNMHFSKVLSFHFDLATSHTIAVAIWLLALHLRAAHGRLTARAWADLGIMFMHGAGMRPYLGDEPEARERRAMLGDPRFAGWLLGYPY